MDNKKYKPLLRFNGFHEDWVVKKFSSVFSIFGNNTLSRVELNYDGGDVKNIHYGDVLIKYNECLNISEEEVPYINNAPVSNYNNILLQNGDIVFADTAEDEVAGKCTEIINYKGENVVAGLHTIPCHPKYTFSAGFLGYYLNSKAYHNQLLPIMQGTKVISVSRSAILLTNILYPSSLPEQELIGNYFKHLDELINSKEKKIAKLKSIKAACLDKMFPKEGEAVPQLRFKGFNEDWVVKKLGEVAPLRGGYAFQSTKYKNEGIPIIRISNILPNGNIGGEYVYYENQKNDDSF